MKLKNLLSKAGIGTQTNGTVKEAITVHQEVETVTRAAAEEHFRQVLIHLGENPNREGLIDTPKRYIKALKELVTPIPFNFTSFEAEGCDEMVVQCNIPFSSLCEHHTLFFSGFCQIGYIPNGRIVGLSKLARAVQYCATGLQNQERITSQVAEMLYKELKPKGVAVVITARHSCMELRGCKVTGALTTTSKMLGAFNDVAELKKEFYTHIYNSK